jgi:hypothetical protein
MKTQILAAGSLALLLSLPLAVQAQGVPGGAAQGAAEGDAAAGPVGAVVGGVVGGVAGGVTGLLGIDQRPRFREYVITRHHPSYQYRGDFAVGVILPGEGVTYYDVPPEYGVPGYRYTVVNDHTVLVDPRTHRIVEIVE